MMAPPALLVAALALGGTGLEPLPEGDGLAAGHPGDRGIAANSAVLFADGFESIKGPRLVTGVHEGGDPPEWNHGWDMAWGGLAVTRRRNRVHAGRQSLAIDLAPGNEPRGMGLSKFLTPGFDRVFFRYYIRYDASFPGGHHTGGAIEGRAPGVPHANPGVYPDGKNKITVLLDHWNLEPGIASPGPLVMYVYHLDQQHEWGEQFYPSGKIQPGTNMYNHLFGPDFRPRPDVVPAFDRWYCYELMVEAGAPGSRGGRVAFWVDGRLAGDFPNLRFRTTADLKLNRVDLGLYESRPHGPHRLWFDDVVVATSYIGPRR